MSGPASPPAAGGAPAAQPLVVADGEQVFEFPVPFQVPIEGPIQYEEAVEKPLVASFPAGGAPAAPPAIDDLPDSDPLLGQPLVIDGRVVAFEEIRKQVCLGPAGMSEIADAQMRIFIEEEKRRRAASGASGVEVGPEEVDGYLEEVQENIKHEYPEGDVGMEDVFSGLVSHDPREKLRLQMEFAKLFLPEDPSQFPPLTLEAILKQEGGQAVLDHYKQVFAQNQSGEVVEKEPGEFQFDAAILQQTLSHLIEVASISAEPAPGVLYRVNGVDILVDDIWERIRDHVTTMEVLAAKQWIVNTTLLQEGLMAAGAWLDDEEAYLAYHAHSDPYKDSLFSIERVAMIVKQFPSVERYKHLRRIQDSFQRMRKPSEAELEEFAEARTNKVIGQVSADVDVLFCSAYDFRHRRWKENGWVEAENRMKDVLRLLVEEQRPWEELLERYSDFYEAPTPVSQRELLDPDRPRKGRFRNVQRNGLLGLLGESDYGMFLTGTSITDFIFFEQEVGTLGQPMRGPFGWYLPRLLRRTKPPKRIPMEEETRKELVLDDFLTTKLNAYVQELIKKHEVYGLEYPGTKPM